ncbi:MAG: DciA family protein [Litorimonas sp.]
MTISRKDKQVLGRWLDTQRGKPQYRPLPTAGMAASRVMRPLAKKHGNGRSAMSLEPVWQQIMGPRWSKISTPVRYTGGKDGRTLIISAPGPAAALIMAASTPIIDRLNAHLGTGHIKRIRVIQSKMRAAQHKTARAGLSPRKTAKLQERLSHLPDDTLKQALEKLGRGVLQQEDT